MSNPHQLNEFEKLWYAGKLRELLEYSRKVSGIEGKYWEIEALLWDRKTEKALDKAVEYKSFFQEGKWIGKYNLFLGRIYKRNGDIDNGIKYCEKSLDVFTALNDEIGIADTYYWLGSLYKSDLNSSKSDEYFQRCHKIYTRFDDKIGIIKSSTNLAGALWHKGEIKTAYHYNQMALDLAKEIDHKIWIIVCSLNLAIPYGFMGELFKALHFTKEAFTMAIELDRKLITAIALHNLGVLYSWMGELDKGIVYSEEAYKIYDKINDPKKVSEILSNLISFEIQNDNMKKAELYFKNLQELESKETKKGITLAKLASQALILKASNRMKDKMLAMEIFEELIYSDEWGKIKTYHKIPHLIELLILEYQSTQEDEILRKIQDNLKAFREQAKQHYNYLAVVNSNILQAHFERIIGNFEKANAILEQTLIMTEEKDLGFLNEKVEKEQENMQKEFVVMKQLVDRNASFTERLEKSHLIKYLRQAQGNLTS